MADAIGLFVLAGLFVIILLLTPAPSVPSLFWVFVYLALAVTALYCWRNKRSPHTPSGWLILALGSVIIGAVYFAIDMILGSYQHQGTSGVEAATRVGGMFGFVLTIAVCPGSTMIALSGFARSLFLSRLEAR
jgi:hypothetical protein